MPYIHADYSQELLSKDQLKSLVALLLKTSGAAFNYNDEQAQEMVSIFTSAYQEADHSLAAAEIEVKAKILEFDHETKSRAEVREEKMALYKEALEQFIGDEKIQAAIIFTITFEDWSVAFMPGVKTN